MTQTYLPRHLRVNLEAHLRQFPVVLVLGARQVGKTTFLRHELKGFTHFDLEDAATAERVGADPALFLHDYPTKIWLDEAHRVPEFFPALRVAVDRDRQAGRFVLSGSATGAMTARVSESLAGRAGLLTLEPFSFAERKRRKPSLFVRELLYASTSKDLVARIAKRRALTDPEVRMAWLTGGFPEPALLEDPAARRRWFDAYIRLVSERDLGELHRDLRAPRVRRLLRMLAARHGQMVNLSSLATDVGVRVSKIQDYLSIMEGTFLWRQVEAYSANIGKRLTRSPRGWITDCGLLHALLDLRGPEDLAVHPLAGASWEGWVLGQLLAQASLLDVPPAFAYWRTHAGAEVDIVLEAGHRLIPVEVKRATRVGPYDLRGINSFLAAFSERAPYGVVLYNGDAALRATDRIALLPIARIL